MIVLDCCAAVEITLQTEKGRALAALIDEDECTLSVELARAELASVFRKLAMKGSITAGQACELLSVSSELVDEWWPMETLQDEVLRESIRLQHSAYDMFYFILARRTGATLFTVDARLAELCLAHGVNCVQEIPLSE